MLQELKKWEFPKRIGTYNDFTQPALEFTKQITTNVFGIDPAFHQEAVILRKNMLRIVREMEFAPHVVNGNEPSLICVLPDVICDLCQTSTDLDICRDSQLNLVDSATGEISSRAWKCRQCEHDLNRGLVERRLIELMNRRVVSYQLQDLKCIKCKMVKNSLVSPYCECTGLYSQTIGYEQPEKLRNQNLLNSVSDIKLFLQLMRNFANHHEMHVLKDAAQKQLIIHQGN
jgi:DNA polymerase epsilon subunit 1